MIYVKAYSELTRKLCAELILRRAVPVGDTPLGYVLELIRDEYGLAKTEGWETAEAVVRHFGLHEFNNQSKPKR